MTIKVFIISSQGNPTGKWSKWIKGNTFLGYN